MSGIFEIEYKRSSWPGYGGPAGHNIKIYCNNRLLEEASNRSEVEEYLLLEKWKKRK